MEGVHVLWPRALGKLIRTEGPLSRDESGCGKCQGELAFDPRDLEQIVPFRASAADR
jgi:hypothetical protein